MTDRNVFGDDPRYRPVLDHGFIFLVDHMGSDAAIIQAARVSYGAGTKSVNDDRGLIRYLLRHSHTTPLEMCEVKFHIKLPIFVARQWIRHRTANVNEISARFSEMSDEFYLPDFEHIQPQAVDNKQGRAGIVSDKSKDGVRWLMETAADQSYQIYKLLLGDRELHENSTELLYTPYGTPYLAPLLDDDFPGIARESARAVMPVSAYTEFYWKNDLFNIMNFLRLRADSHAQYEIRVYAEAMIDLVTPLFPLAMEAFQDYVHHAVKLSRMDLILVKDAIADVDGIAGLEATHGSEKDLGTAYGLSLREIRNLKAQFA